MRHSVRDVLGSTWMLCCPNERCVVHLTGMCCLAPVFDMYAHHTYMCRRYRCAGATAHVLPVRSHWTQQDLRRKQL